MKHNSLKIIIWLQLVSILSKAMKQ